MIMSTIMMAIKSRTTTAIISTTKNTINTSDIKSTLRY